MICRRCQLKIEDYNNYRLVAFCIPNNPAKAPANIWYRNVYEHKHCPTGDELAYSKVCPYCKKTFSTLNSDDIYCSQGCKDGNEDTTLHSVATRYRDAKPSAFTMTDELRKKFADEMKEHARRSIMRNPTPIQRRTFDSVTRTMAPAPASSKETRNDDVSTFTVRNEQGVVWTWAQVAGKLGYEMVDIRTEYPDAVMLSPAGQRIAVEFEYKSGNFITHGHDPAECDLVVCWSADKVLDGVEVVSLQSLLLE